jgi:asparagine synthase (glutamine-hydrolysing)
VEAQLGDLAVSALGPEPDDAAVEKFVRLHEGSYVVVLARPDTRQLLLFTDPFCRLPLYYSTGEAGLIVAREAKFVHALRPGRSFDRVGCAQILAFGLPLGDRTALEGVRSFPGAGLLRADVAGGRLRCQVRKTLEWNLDDEDHSKPVAYQARKFTDLFLTACRNWGSHPASDGNLVSLSGGHDSRAVAAGLARSGAAVVAVSYRDPNGLREDEVRYARRLAEELELEWHCIDLPPPDAAAFERLAWLKDGMNVSSMAYILNYLEEIVRRWGRHRTYLSGDGGDDCLKVTAPRYRFRHVEDAVQHVMERETRIRPYHAEAILKLPPGVLRDELRNLFESYPEREPSRRVKHFRVFERARRFYFEGEDRTRSYLWQDSPFYSLPLFRHCIRIPDTQKYYKTFCRQAMVALSPAAARAPVTSSGFAPASLKYRLYHRAHETVLRLPQPLVKVARFITGNLHEPTFDVPGPCAAYLQDQLSTDTPLAALMDAGQVPDRMRGFDSRSFFSLWTVAMLEKAYRSRLGRAVFQ